MKVVIGYQVIKAESSEGLTNRVTNLLEEGWEPVDGMRVTDDIIDDEIKVFYFYQTLFKYDYSE